MSPVIQLNTQDFMVWVLIMDTQFTVVGLIKDLGVIGFRTGFKKLSGRSGNNNSVGQWRPRCTVIYFYEKC